MAEKKSAPTVRAVEAAGEFLHLDNLLKDAEGMALQASERLRAQAATASGDNLAWLVQDYQRGQYIVAQVKSCIKQVQRISQMMGK